MANKGLAIGIGIVIIIIIIGAVFVYTGKPAQSIATTTTSASSPSMAAAPVMITDPAQVPAGTSALFFTYTNLQVNSTTPSGSSWVNAAGSGSVNLIAIRNKSQVMGYANVAANSTISAVRLNITTVMITVNGTTYSVPISYTQVTIPVSGNAKIGPSSGILIDYTPTVSPGFTQNTTIFVRVPAAKAAVVSGINSSFATSVGATAQNSASANVSIAAVTPNVQIMSAAIASQGNTTTLSVTVKNNGNQSVMINTVNVYGAQRASATASISANVSAAIASSVNGALGGIYAGKTIIPLSANATALFDIGVNLESYNMQTFSASSSGSMVLVANLSSVQSGVTVAPGATVTLTYNGTATYNSGTFQTAPQSGTQYQINVVGSTGAYTTTTATAT